MKITVPETSQDRLPGNWPPALTGLPGRAYYGRLKGFRPGARRISRAGGRLLSIGHAPARLMGTLGQDKAK
jgi:hypothetical protein